MIEYSGTTSRLGICHQRGTNPRHFVRRDRNARSGPAADDPLVCPAIRYGARDIGGHERPIARGIASTELAEFYWLIAALLNLIQECFRQF